MKLKRFWNEKTRLMLTLELAVALPAAALIAASVWHLTTIQRESAIAGSYPARLRSCARD